MEIAIEPSKLPQTVPLKLFEKIFIGSAENNGESFDVYMGLDEDLATQLRNFSIDLSDTALQENTSDFARFGEEGYETWYAKDRVPFALVHRDTGALAALIWFGPKPLGLKSLKHLTMAQRESENISHNDAWHTIVFRSYPPFRGTGIMRKFVEAATIVYRNYFPQARFWAGISRNNPSSIALAEKLGYREDRDHSDEKWVAMVKENL